jgi:hypothetical protein
MPTITENTVPVWVFCPDGGCLGYETQEMQGVAREVSRSAFEEAGPQTLNGNAVASSFFQFLVASGEVDELGHAIASELECEHCGRQMQVSPTPRPEYTNSSGQDPMTLLNRRKEAERGIQRDSEVTALRAQLDAQQAQMAALLAGLAGGQKPEPDAKPRKAKADPDEAA